MPSSGRGSETRRTTRATGQVSGRHAGKRRHSLGQFHGLVAQIALVLAVLTAGLAAARALTRRTPGSFLAGGLLWTGLVLVVATLSGIGVAVLDHPPSDPLHLLYGVLAVAALPGAALIARGRPGTQPAVVWAVAGIVLVILVLRLFQTGG